MYIKCTLYSVHTWIQYKYMVEGGGVEENINVHEMYIIQCTYLDPVQVYG